MPETSTGIVRRAHYIGGEQVEPASGESFDRHDPAIRETLSRRRVTTSVTSTAPSTPRVGPSRKLARKQSLDNGKLLREMRTQMAAVPEHYLY
jgi:hypothetical protein